MEQSLPPNLVIYKHKNRWDWVTSRFLKCPTKSKQNPKSTTKKHNNIKNEIKNEMQKRCVMEFIFLRIFSLWNLKLTHESQITTFKFKAWVNQ